MFPKRSAGIFQSPARKSLITESPAGYIAIITSNCVRLLAWPVPPQIWKGYGNKVINTIPMSLSIVVNKPI